MDYPLQERSLRGVERILAVADARRAAAEAGTGAAVGAAAGAAEGAESSAVVAVVGMAHLAGVRDALLLEDWTSLSDAYDGMSP